MIGPIIMYIKCEVTKYTLRPSIRRYKSYYIYQEYNIDTICIKLSLNNKINITPKAEGDRITSIVKSSP